MLVGGCVTMTGCERSVLNALLIFCSLHSSICMEILIHPRKASRSTLADSILSLFYGVFGCVVQLSMAFLHTNINIMIAAFMCVKA